MRGKGNEGLTRREFLKRSGKIAAGTGFWMTSLGRSPAFGAKKDTMIVGMTQEAVLLNPLLYVLDGPEGMVEDCVFDALCDIDENGVFVPNLAVRVPTIENRDISRDGLTWKFELKKGVKWQDGQPFTAKDVDFTIKTVMNPKVPVRSRFGFDNVKGFRVVDDYHVEVTLSKPYAPFVWTWQTLHIVPEHILSKVPDIRTAPFSSQPMGTGPFTFHERVAGSHITYKRNPNYHRGAAGLETLIQKFVPNQAVMYTQFKTGEIDLLLNVGIAPERYEEAKALKDREIFLCPRNSVEQIIFNCGKPQFKDPRVRRALYLAVDKDRWIKDIFYGLVPRTLSYLKPDHWAYNTELKDPGYNPGEAARLLDAAGWKVGSDGIREKDGVKLRLTVSATSGERDREQAEVLLQQNWKDINVATEIRNFPSAVVYGEYWTKSQFEVLIRAYSPAPVGFDPDNTTRLHSKYIPIKYGQGANYNQYENPEVDKLLDEGVATYDRNKRKDIYWKVQKILLDEVPSGPIFNWSMIFGRKSDVLGYKVNPFTTHYTLNVAEWAWR